MYAYPVLLPPFSNREDFLLTVSIFDDDTGDAVNLSGTSLANPGADFTGSQWTVTDGSIVTTSTDTITIPNFPIGDELSALALTADDGLDIEQGDPIQIADPTGLNTLSGYVVSYAATTGALVCQIGVTFQFEIRHQRRGPGGSCDGYSPFNDIGIASNEGAIITASLGNGITITDIGFAQILIPEIQMRCLHNRTYLASMTMTDSVNTRQIFIGKLPEQFGGVTN